MKVAIVEDELLAATYLKSLLEKQSFISIKEIVVLRSVQQSLNFFKDQSVDLIFMDIHLGDGKSFEIFEQLTITAPIIFITAYDTYALKVFKQFTIDYILKPFEEAALHQALRKFTSLALKLENTHTLDSIVAINNASETGIKNRFLVTHGYKLKSIISSDIAYFEGSGKHLFLYTRDGNSYIYNDTIKDIIAKLDETKFFKVNRKFIVHIDSIGEIIKHSSQRIELILTPTPVSNSPILVSKSQINELKIWLNQ
ncbi:LytTR family DNA-binding domain-containing protein [Flavobacterium sp. NKUCC04_CG]|uniref:LytR/AlgR family response regulator transcription factor n=1 Tax=Flavobacterium sp. NKUCC04_CG TaxID=2842121 RepID=UPI001C5B782A|nr:LytTR family DNA-binding domain-containing protein [Flavobacterium sp. NKUCC04_CG]MBW3518111.1 LytTR family DNA-binding domain-containing protein [Flavobacterium sp. NKUCC04_CG]